MKTWSTGAPNPRGDLYVDETPVGAGGICEQYRAMVYVFKTLPREQAKVVLDALGLA